MFVIKSLHLISVHFWTYLLQGGDERVGKNDGGEEGGGMTHQTNAV